MRDTSDQYLTLCILEPGALEAGIQASIDHLEALAREADAEATLAEKEDSLLEARMARQAARGYRSSLGALTCLLRRLRDDRLARGAA